MKKKLTATHLKFIALISMFIDHFAATIIKNYAIVNGINTYTLFNPFEADTTVGVIYSLMRTVGRLAFPLYIFLLVEGFRHTRNIKKYIIRMVIFAFISEIPFDLAFYGRIFEPSHQNVFITMSLGLILLYILDQLELKKLKFKTILAVLAVCLVAFINEYINADYGAYGIIFIAVIYLYRNNPKVQAIMMFIVGTGQYTAALAGPITYFYNGKKGKQINKYFFYLFYPAHLLLFYFIVRFFIYT